MNMNRLNTARKWGMFLLASIIVYFVGAGICSHFPWHGIVPTMLPVIIAYVGFLSGSVSGAMFGLCAGLFGVVTGANGGNMILGGAIIGMLSGFNKDAGLQFQTLTGLLSALEGLVISELIHVIMLCGFQGQDFQDVFQIALPELVYSMILAVPAWFLFRKMCRGYGDRG